MHLTEQIGQGFEISIIHGDFWDLTVSFLRSLAPSSNSSRDST